MPYDVVVLYHKKVNRIIKQLMKILNQSQYNSIGLTYDEKDKIITAKVLIVLISKYDKLQDIIYLSKHYQQIIAINIDLKKNKKIVYEFKHLFSYEEYQEDIYEVVLNELKKMVGKKRKKEKFKQPLIMDDEEENDVFIRIVKNKQKDDDETPYYVSPMRGKLIDRSTFPVTSNATKFKKKEYILKEEEHKEEPIDAYKDKKDYLYEEDIDLEEEHKYDEQVHDEEDELKKELKKIFADYDD